MIQSNNSVAKEIKTLSDDLPCCSLQSSIILWNIIIIKIAKDC